MHEVWLIYGDEKPGEDVSRAVSGDRWNVTEVPYKQLSSFVSSGLPDAAVAVSFNKASPDEKKSSKWFLRAIDALHRVDENVPVVAILPIHSMSDAVDAMKSGAFDCLSMPSDLERLKRVIENGVRLYDLTKRVYLLESESGSVHEFENMIGHSVKMRDVFQMIKVVSKSSTTVLILGESGTGKELVARAIHKNSTRTEKPFVDINCGAIPHELLENELFGHEKGAYTGADKRYVGSFEAANTGTIFLDEISEMDLTLQVKLLRFLQERVITRVGGTQPIKLDVRIIAATNRNLEEEVRAGRFREDLFYRLNVVPITVPPLRERRDDVSLLAHHFLRRFSEKNEKIFMDISPLALEALVSYDWPGNVRELENVMERIVVLNNDSRVKPSHLPAVITDTGKQTNTEVAAMFTTEGILPLDLVERYAIEDAIRKCMGNVSEAARKLNIGQATLYRKIRKYGLRG